jgi:long-chain acyl-CoA synthetase
MQAYGLTETSPVVTMSGNDCYRLGSVGKALPGVEAKVVDCDDNGVGELVVKGPNVMLGYYDNPEETNEAIVDGWFHTGDQARIDEDGYVFICGRKKNVIVLKNGKNVFPEEIEQMVNKIDGVVECVVYGREHSKNKDDVRVFVKIVYNPEVMKNVYQAVDEKQIYNAFVEEIKVINRSMPSYKAIRGVVITDKPFDKTSTGKIKRKV